MYLLSSAGFLRFGELIKIKRQDIVLVKHQLKVTLCFSMADKYRKGSTVVISRAGKKTCPVLHLEKYLHFANVSPSDDEHIFVNFVTVRS